MIVKAALVSTVFYASLVLGAIAPRAADLTPETAAQVKALRGDAMRMLAIHDEPRRSFPASFKTEEGGDTTLASYAGKVLLVNFWATWCAPCREEMPHLNALQKTLGSDAFEVLTIATGRNPPASMKKFFRDYAIDALPLHTDPSSTLSRQAGAIGLPVTLLLDRKGREIARLTGAADWNSDAAHSVIKHVIALTAP